LLEILVDSETNLNLGVSYIVSDAGWVPSYDLRAESVKKPLEMVYKGKIYQKTGQDWKNIKLFVSTYRPSYNQDRLSFHHFMLLNIRRTIPLWKLPATSLKRDRCCKCLSDEEKRFGNPKSDSGGFCFLIIR
jgi:hypothetical protein